MQHLADQVTVGQCEGWLLDDELDAAGRVLALEVCGDAGGLGTEVYRPEADLCSRDARYVQQGIEDVAYLLAGGLNPPSIAEAILAEGVCVVLYQSGAEPGERAQRGPQVMCQGVDERLQVLIGPSQVLAGLPLVSDVADGGGYDIPSLVSTAARAISAGNVVPSQRQPERSRSESS